MEEVTCIYRWMLVRVSAETLFGPIIGFQQDRQYHVPEHQESNSVCETEHCSALSPSDALAENG